jgi:hypothetical protein
VRRKTPEREEEEPIVGKEQLSFIRCPINDRHSLFTLTLTTTTTKTT